MEWLEGAIFQHSALQAVIVLSLIVSVGLGLGKIKICGITLGVTWVFFAGILAGHFGLSIDHQMLLYAESFLPMLPYIDVAVCGVVLRAFSYCVAFVILARGDGRTYVVTEAAGAVAGLVLRIVGYRLWGFAGLGWAYVAEYAVYSAIVLAAYRRYGLRLGRGIGWLCAGVTALGFAALAIKTVLKSVI